jgi:CDP-diacylglycerol--serine O-phosphatidyltransferase
MYHWSLSGLKLAGPAWGKLGWALAFLYAACAALRLARFNVQTGSTDKRYFIGLASPAAAALMMSFVWICTSNGLSGDSMRIVAPVVTALAALLMVSRFRYHSFKALPMGERVPFVAILIAVGVFVALAIDPPSVLFAIAVLYMLSGPGSWVWQRIRRRAV